jgi:FkbM family methyltransferase
MKKTKKFYNLIINFLPLFIFLKPIRFLRNSKSLRFVQEACISRAAKTLQKVMVDFNYIGGIVISQEAILVEYEGVRLDTKYTNRYFKAETSPNVAKDMLDLIYQVVKKETYSPKFIVDIGANVGEVSLYFANKFPKAEVVVVEAHPDNIQALMCNLEFNNHSIANENIIKKAVSNNGNVFFTKKRSAKARIESLESADTIQVDSITLASLMNQYDNPFIDFLKIDIEGGEIFLIDCLIAMIERIGVSIIEMSSHTDKGKQLSIFELFLINDFGIYYEHSAGSLNKITSINDIKALLDKDVTMDFLFVSESMIEK